MNEIREELRAAIREKRTFQNPWLYRIGDGLLAKQFSSSASKKEYEIGRDLERNNIPAPHMYFLIDPDPIVTRFFYKAPISKKTVILDRIEGTEIRELEGDDLREATQQYKESLLASLDLGYYPRDHWNYKNGTRNAIFGEDGRLYLIDFELWRKGTANELRIFYDSLLTPLKMPQEYGDSLDRYFQDIGNHR